MVLDTTEGLLRTSVRMLYSKAYQDHPKIIVDEKLS